MSALATGKPNARFYQSGPRGLVRSNLVARYMILNYWIYWHSECAAVDIHLLSGWFHLLPLRSLAGAGGEPLAGWGDQCFSVWSFANEYQNRRPSSCCVLTLRPKPRCFGAPAVLHHHFAASCQPWLPCAVSPQAILKVLGHSCHGTWVWNPVISNEFELYVAQINRLLTLEA